MQNTSTTLNDCIVAWSGGVESTALLHQLVLEKRNPLVFHIQCYVNNKQANLFETHAVEQMAESYFNLDVHYIDVVLPCVKPARTSLFWRGKSYGRGVPFMPIVSSTAFNLQLFHPWIKEIYSGANALEFQWDKPEYALRNKYYNDLSKIYGCEVKYINGHLGHLDKKEQWLMIPEEMRKWVRSCTAPQSEPCGKCTKCKERERFIDKS